MHSNSKGSLFWDTLNNIKLKIEHFTLHFSYAKDFAVSNFLFFTIFVRNLAKMLTKRKRFF